MRVVVVHPLCYLRLLTRNLSVMPFAPSFDCNVPSSCRSSQPNWTIRASRSICSTPFLCKDKRKGGPKVRQKQGRNANISMEESDEGEDSDSDEENGAERLKEKKSEEPNLLAKKALGELEEYYQILGESLTKHLSLQVNLKVFEDLSVTLENGETHRLIKFARISMKGHRGPIVLNFGDNPSAIKPARIAIQKMAENVNPQQEGILLNVPIPKITRERREELAKNASKLIFNEYKTALNEVYGKYSRLIEKSTNQKELIIRLNSEILKKKRDYDQKGADTVKEKQKALLKEIELG